MILFMVKLFNQANLKLQVRIVRNLFTLIEGRSNYDLMYIKDLIKYLYLDSLCSCIKCKAKEEIKFRNIMAKRAPYKGNKEKVEILVKKMIKDNMYDPNEEELWLINDYDRFGLYAKPVLISFEKYYDKLWEELKKLRRMDIEVFEELVGNPNIYLIDLLIEPFTEYIRKKKESKSMLMLQKLNIVFVDDRLILN